MGPQNSQNTVNQNMIIVTFWYDINLILMNEFFTVFFKTLY